MSTRNIRLLIIFIILLGVAWIYQGPLQSWQTDKNKSDNFFSGINIDNIDKIEINNNGKSSVLVKEASSTGSGQVSWKVDGTKDFYVNQDLSDNFVSVLKEAQADDFELVSESADKKTDFYNNGVGIEVSLFSDNNDILDFIVGRLGSDFSSTYITQEGISETYLVDASLFGAFSITDWRDKTIFANNQADVNKIRLQYPNREFTVERQEQGWVGVSPYSFEVDEEKVNEVLSLMTDLTAIGLPEQTFEGTGLEKNSIIVEASGDVFSNTIMLGDADENGFYFAKRGDSDNIYLISEEQKIGLDKSIGDLQ